MHVDFKGLTDEKSDVSFVSQDPLDRDRPEDDVVVTSRRGLIRMALVAAETATRFALDGIEHDPVAWMTAPRRLFDGRGALTACLELEHCVRAVMVHGLRLDLDADPEEIDALCADAEADGGGIEVVGMPEDVRPPRLWTSYLIDEESGGSIHAFDAVVAPSRSEAEDRLRARHRSTALEGLELMEGFDPSRPLAEALVSPALADMLEQVAHDPTSPLARGLSVSIEQRFAA